MGEKCDLGEDGMVVFEYFRNCQSTEVFPQSHAHFLQRTRITLFFFRLVDARLV